ncbi:MAG: uS2 family ribosomal protein, partial [Prevotellaceae bacterium]|nr:uS2 family ribosomal protein [Prevotellaceae bacterium]
DTNSNPDLIDFVIPANDDAAKSIDLIVGACCDAINEGIEERKAEKIDMEAAGEPATPSKGKRRSSRARLDRTDEEAINAAKAAAYAKKGEEDDE